MNAQRIPREQVRALKDAAQFKPAPTAVSWIPTFEDALRHFAVLSAGPDFAASDVAGAELERRWPGNMAAMLAEGSPRALYRLARDRRANAHWRCCEELAKVPGRMLRRAAVGAKMVHMHIDGVLTRDVM